jgi:hypothetical protein
MADSVRFSEWQEIFSLFRSAERLWGPLSLLLSGVPSDVFPGMKRAVRDDDNLFYSVSVYPNALYLHGLHRDNFTFTLLGVNESGTFF